jgi:hypothetical protein
MCCWLVLGVKLERLFDRSISESELLRGIKQEWAVDSSHLMNEFFGGVSSTVRSVEGLCSTGKFIAVPEGGLIIADNFSGAHGTHHPEKVPTSRFNKHTAIFGLWGDLWHGTRRRRTYRGGAGRVE